MPGTESEELKAFGTSFLVADKHLVMQPYTLLSQKQRRRVPGTRRSRSHSRSRQGNLATPLFTRDGGSGQHPQSGKRPRGGALVRHVLRRSQTTGDMDAPDKPPGREMSTEEAGK